MSATGIALDLSGNLYIADTYNHRVRKVDGNGIITTLAGTSTSGYSGDGGPAVDAQLNTPYDVAVDASGNVFISDSGNNAIRKVDPNGIVTTIAGSGATVALDSGWPYSADGGLATQASLYDPEALAVDANGNLYLAETGYVRRISATTQTIETIAGANYYAGGLYGVDGTPATQLVVGASSGLALDARETLYISDETDSLVTQVLPTQTAFSMPETAVGLISAASTVKILNVGSQPLNFSGLSVSQNFIQQPSGGNDCDSSAILTMGSECSVSFIFAPNSAGSLSGALLLTDNSLNQAGSQQEVMLSGASWPGELISFSGASLNFGTILVGRPASLAMTVINPGRAPLNISSITVTGAFSGQFTQANNCGAVLGVNATCQIIVTFSPTQGYSSASISVADSAPGSPHTFAVSGSGEFIPIITASPSSLTFDAQTVGTTSGAQTITLFNSGNAAFYYPSIQFSGANTPDFSETDTCRGQTGTPPGGNCVISVFFNPTWVGVRQASVQVEGAGIQTVILSGSGISPALRFVPITPCRVADTRKSGGIIGGNTTRDFYFRYACGSPANAAAYSLNVTAIPSGPLGYLSVWPSGETQPSTSTLNSDGRVKASAAVVAAGQYGSPTVYVTDPTNLVLDMNGYFVPLADPSGLAFYPLSPCRVADTRNPAAPLGGPYLKGGQSRTFPILSACNIPSSAEAYSLNLTAVPHGSLGYLTAWGAGQGQPPTSTLNAPTGAITANAAIIAAGTNGDVAVFATNDTDLVIDVDGYFAPPNQAGLSFYYLNPCRALDTRTQAGSQPLSGINVVDIVGSGCSVPIGAQAYVLNVTAVPTSTLGYLTLWPNGENEPLVSTLNATDGSVISNMAVVPSSNGLINVFGSDATNLILDISGYFAP